MMLSDSAEQAGSLSSLLHDLHHEVGAERRSYSRHELDHEIWLLDPMTLKVIHCHAANISEMGLSASAPAWLGLAVGQRFEVRIAPHVFADSVPRHTVSLGYATIIRSRTGSAARLDGRINFAIRFDFPRFLPAL